MTYQPSNITVTASGPKGLVRGTLEDANRLRVDSDWVWVDVLGAGADEIQRIGQLFGFDSLAIADVVDDIDFPKLDDFGDHLLLILHGVAAEDEAITTIEFDCFLTDRVLVTFHPNPAPAIEWFSDQLHRSQALRSGGADELLARLAEVLCRRYVPLIDELDRSIDTLNELALRADPGVLLDLAAIRADVASIRRVLNPQRETIDEIRRLDSPLLSAAGRRRFSDVFDVTDRLVHTIEIARSELSDVLDSFHGTEAKRMTEVTRVLTIYAALLLPLSLVAGFFGMNFPNLPWLAESWGWLIVLAAMVALLMFSLLLFARAGWVRLPFLAETGERVGRGLVAAVRAPIRVANATYQAVVSPIRLQRDTLSPPRREFPGAGSRSSRDGG